jgi:hypothetical protein
MYDTEDSKAAWRGDRSKKFKSKRPKKTYGRQGCNCGRCQGDRVYCDVRDRKEADRQIFENRFED